MPIEIKFDNIPAGYAESSARGGDMIKVSQYGFYSSEDGDELVQRLEGLPQLIISLIPTNQLILPSMVDTLLAIIKKDKTAKVYLNEVKLLGQMRVKGGVQKGEIITANRVLDIGRMKFVDIEIPDDAGIIFVFSVGWRKGFLYDLVPLHSDPPQNRDYNIGELLGSLYSYLNFQERFKVDENTWKRIFDQRWFLFTYLDNSLVKEMVSHSREDWNIDDLLPKIEDNVRKLLKDIRLTEHKNTYFNEHASIFETGFERYIEQDYISCTSILYPRIEGLLRSFFRAGGYKGKPKAEKLSEAAIKHHEKSRVTHSLLLPSKFHNYLNNIYFANFAPGSKPNVGRHSVAHGEAREDDFNLKSATLAILIIYQLSLFMSDGNKDKTNVEQAYSPDGE